MTPGVTTRAVSKQSTRKKGKALAYPDLVLTPEGEVRAVLWGVTCPSSDPQQIHGGGDRIPWRDARTGEWGCNGGFDVFSRSPSAGELGTGRSQSITKVGSM